jgi:hypothetical protein
MSRETESEFSYQLVKDGNVRILWRDRHVVTLTGQKAATFRERVESADEREAQLLMARVTGNFKRGNERASKDRE